MRRMSTGPCVVELPTLRYDFAGVHFGRIAIVMSESGVVDICLGETDQELLTQLSHRFPRNLCVPDEGTHATWVGAVVSRLAGSEDACATFPIDCGAGVALSA